MKALIFDVDDTLYDQYQPFRKAVVSHLELDDEKIYGIYVASRKYSDLVFEASEKGDMTKEDMHLFRLKSALQDYDIHLSDSKILAIQHTYKENQSHIVLDSSIREVFEYCTSKGIKLGVITNGPADHQLQKIHQLNLSQWIPLENVIISGQIGIMKPDPAIFHFLEKKMNLSTEDCVYVGDSFENDILGANSAGWSSIWVNARKKVIDDIKKYTPYVITERTDLLAIIKTINKE